MFFAFFFFKQKTAYEMRISDWSSDVCSSDLTSSCSGEIWRSSSLSRPPRYCSVRDWFMSIQTGDAYRCQTSIEYQLRPSVDVVNFDGSGPSPSPCHSSKHPLTGSAFSPGLRNVTM